MNTNCSLCIYAIVMYARTYRIRQYEEKLFHDKSLSEMLYAGIHMISEFMIAAFSQMQIHRVFEMFKSLAITVTASLIWKILYYTGHK